MINWRNTEDGRPIGSRKWVSDPLTSSDSGSESDEPEMHEAETEKEPLTQSPPIEVPQPPQRASWKDSLPEDVVSDKGETEETPLPDRLT